MASLKMVQQTPKHVGSIGDKYMYVTFYVHLAGIKRSD